MTSTENILKIRDLSLQFGGVRALDNINIDIKKDTITALIGPNGAGKTSLFNCITGFYRPSTGDIHYQLKGENHTLSRLLGKPWEFEDFFLPQRWFTTLYAALSKGSHRLALLGIARTFQNIRLFREMTVIENCLVALYAQVHSAFLAEIFNTASFKRRRNEAIDQAFFWLQSVGLEPHANRLAVELPYGHQRLLEIARAMCMHPQLICLDEPAAGLNPNERQELQALILKLNETYQTTVLLIEHDVDLVMNTAEQIIVFDHGQCIAQGSPSEIQHNPKVVTAYLGD